MTASALDWVRSKATPAPSLSDTFDYEGRSITSHWRTFRGRVPFRMIRELSGCEKISTEYHTETLRLDRKNCTVEYAEITYTGQE